MKKITIVGMGYVGLANAVLLAQHNQVTVFDLDSKKIELSQNEERLYPVDRIEQAMRMTEIIFSKQFLNKPPIRIKPLWK